MLKSHHTDPGEAQDTSKQNQMLMWSWSKYRRRNFS
jgi:hypothetical protein